MLTKFAIIFIVALIFALIFYRLRLPELLGMLLAGVILGPHCLGWLSTEFIGEASELRTGALIIILIRAGLGINKETLNKIGMSAAKMSFIPCLLEGSFVIAASWYILKFPLVESGILGFILAAVSPAVIVPQMLNLIDAGYGKRKGVPTLILAGASIDDVFAITFFGAFLGIALGETQNITLAILNIPLRIGLGIAIGLLFGYLLALFFRRFDKIRDTKKVLIFMISAIVLYDMEKVLPIASLVGIMAIGFIILEKNREVAKRLAAKFNKVWVFAEIILFVLIGAQVNLDVAFSSGLVGLAIIFIGLVGRSIGVFLSLIASHFNEKERLFCVLSYVPKATVQAAIGAIPLSMGIPSGELILAIAVLSIVVTAPIGSILIKATYRRLLEPPLAEGLRKEL
jgi:NhaP-type Na+/H+ or K+/H+ antiporter